MSTHIHIQDRVSKPDDLWTVKVTAVDPAKRQVSFLHREIREDNYGNKTPDYSTHKTADINLEGDETPLPQKHYSVTRGISYIGTAAYKGGALDMLDNWDVDLHNVSSRTGGC